MLFPKVTMSHLQVQIQVYCTSLSVITSLGNAQRLETQLLMLGNSILILGYNESFFATNK